MNWLLENPVFVKEVKVRLRLRASRPALVILAILAVVVVLWCYGNAAQYLLRERGVARAVWDVGVVLQALGIWLVAPGLTANAVTQEREQQTWEMLLFTRLSESEIVLGKLAARALPLAALGLLALPPMVGAAWLGGVPLHGVATAYACSALWALLALTAGLFCSWCFRATIPATVAVYAAVTVLVIGTAVLEQMAVTLVGSYRDAVLIWLNPVYVAGAASRIDGPGNVAAVAANSVAYSAAIAAMLAVMLKRLRRTAGAP